MFVKYVIGNEANLGANAPNYSFPLPVVFGIEVLASALLMAVIFAVVHTKGLRGFSGIAIGGIVGLDIFFFAFISGASMNPARSLGSCIVVWLFRRLVVVLDCNIYWNVISCFNAKEKICSKRNDNSTMSSLCFKVTRLSRFELN